MADVPELKKVKKAVEAEEKKDAEEGETPKAKTEEPKSA